MRKPIREHRDRKRQQGSVMIEASLVLMLFLTILWSLFDFGFSLFLHQSFVHEGRTGARYGAINPGLCTESAFRALVPLSCARP
jgi:hypothetical protein